METTFDTHWKSFESNEISHSETHYLLSIYSLSRTNIKVRAIDLANDLEVSRNAVSLKLKKLQTKKLVKVTDNFISLSSKGSKIIKRITSKRDTMKVFLEEVLGLSSNIASIDSCKIEHLISDETGEALLKFVHFLRSDKKVVLSFLKEFQKTSIKCDLTKGCGLCDNINEIERKVDNNEE